MTTINQEQLNKKLLKAIENSNLDIVKYLVEQGEDIHIDNDCPLRLSATNGDLDIVKY
jgi:ankyrin repeat protein